MVVGEERLQLLAKTLVVLVLSPLLDPHPMYWLNVFCSSHSGDGSGFLSRENWNFAIFFADPFNHGSGLVRKSRSQSVALKNRAFMAPNLPDGLYIPSCIYGLSVEDDFVLQSWLPTAMAGREPRVRYSLSMMVTDLYILLKRVEGDAMSRGVQAYN
jgi:hypothetical protein